MKVVNIIWKQSTWLCSAFCVKIFVFFLYSFFMLCIVVPNFHLFYYFYLHVDVFVISNIAFLCLFYLIVSAHCDLQMYSLDSVLWKLQIQLFQCLLTVPIYKYSLLMRLLWSVVRTHIRTDCSEPLFHWVGVE